MSSPTTNKTLRRAQMLYRIAEAAIKDDYDTTEKTARELLDLEMEAARQKYRATMDAAVLKREYALSAALKETEKKARVLDPAQVAFVYVGGVTADGRVKCMCGCSGKHTYASQHRAWSSADRGYDVGDKEISDRVVESVVRKINRAFLGLIEEATNTERDEYSAEVIIGRRFYYAHLADRKAKK